MYNNQISKTLPYSCSSVSDRTECIVPITGHITLKMSQNLQEM